ncbi:MAG: GNAT family N-acetyltransferase [Leptolyngbyaceae cyanobacterium]|mgnify:CR=1 FL=1
MSPIYHVRKAHLNEVGDLPAIERRAAQLFADRLETLGLTIEGLDQVNEVDDLARAIAAGRLWVAETVHRELVGFALVLDFGEYAHLDELSVVPEHGQQGVGSALLHQVCAWATAAGYQAVTLRTFRDVPWNAPFYQRRGFAIIDSAELTPQHVELAAIERGRGLRSDLRVAMVYPITPI